MSARACFFTVLLLWFAASARADSAIDWQPARTWVFVVGLLEWQHAELWGAFPQCKPDRRDEQLVEHFQKAGVPAAQMVYLQDRQATLKAINDQFQTLLKKTRSGDMLVFYFAGHGSRDRRTGQTWFANYDAGNAASSCWNVSDIYRAIELDFRGDRALLMADCCHSGALFDQAKTYPKSHISYAVLTSANSHNSSTGRWTFSDSLLAGLRGDPILDLDGDRSIELQELAAYSESEMAFIEGQKSMFSASANFSGRIKLAPVQGAAKSRVGQRVEVLWKEKWYKAKVIDVDGLRLKIHYVNFESSWDEWVVSERVRPYQPPQFAVGDHVDVLWKDGKWYAATVQRGFYGLHLVRYTGYDANADEWIGPDKIRLGQE